MMGLVKPVIRSPIWRGHPLVNGLVERFRFNNGAATYALGEVAGLSAAMNNTFSGNTDWVPSYMGGGLKFGGAGYLLIGSTATLGLDSFSIGMWFTPTALTGFQRLWSSKTGAQDQSYSVLFNGSNLCYQINNGNGYLNTSATAFSNNVLYCVVVVFDTVANTVVYYINGKKDANTYTETANITNAAHTGMFGSQTEVGQYFNGIIDDFCLWNHPLSADEALDYYTNPYGMYENPRLDWTMKPTAGGVPAPYWSPNFMMVD